MAKKTINLFINIFTMSNFNYIHCKNIVFDIFLIKLCVFVSLWQKKDFSELALLYKVTKTNIYFKINN